MFRAFRGAIQSIGQNRLRSCLAGFGIAWGILLLIIFLGIGNGFREGVMKLFDGFAQKSLFVYGGRTSTSYHQVSAGSVIEFDKNIVLDIRKRYPSAISCSEVLNSAGQFVSYREESIVNAVQGVSSDYFRIKILATEKGRSFNLLDNLKCRNVAVIGEGVEQSLFKKESSVGKSINIGGILFKVVGVLATDNLFSMSERNSIYIPSSAFLGNFSPDKKVQSFCLSLDADSDVNAIEKDLRSYLAYRYGFSPGDEQAVYVANIESQTSAFDSLFNGLEILIWIIGICLLLSGIVGVCNVMLIIVKERTNEIGIRKAVGATQGSIISMILSESVTITVLAGAIGVALGFLLVLLGDKVILPMLNVEIMDKLVISVPAIAAAFIILCICGVLAGLFPALKASQIAPVDAIRYDNR